MAILVESFRLLSCVGLWKPVSWTGWRSSVYNMYAVLIFVVHNAFVLGEILEILLSKSNGDDQIDVLVSLSTMFAVSVKIIGLHATRDSMIDIFEKINAELGSPTEQEMSIKKTYDKSYRSYFLAYAILLEVSLSLNTLGRLYADASSYILPFKVYVPYNYTEPGIFQLTVLLDFIAVVIATNIEIAFDSLFCGTMIQICAIIRIFKLRLQIAVSSLERLRSEESCDELKYRSVEKQFLADLIKSHDVILSLSAYIESVFSKVIFIQYYLSSFAVCTSVYILSQTPLSGAFIGITCYLIVVTSEIFTICFSANQVTLEFADLSQAIYDTKWFVLSIPGRKSIIVMMTRTLRPIVFTAGHLVPLSLESFKSLMKVSYSLYNVLKS